MENLSKTPVVLNLDLAKVAILLAALEGMVSELAADAIQSFIAQENPNVAAELALQAVKLIDALERAGDVAAAASRSAAAKAAMQ